MDSSLTRWQDRNGIDNCIHLASCQRNVLTSSYRPTCISTLNGDERTNDIPFSRFTCLPRQLLRAQRWLAVVFNTVQNPYINDPPRSLHSSYTPSPLAVVRRSIQRGSGPRYTVNNRGVAQPSVTNYVTMS